VVAAAAEDAVAAMGGAATANAHTTPRLNFKNIANTGIRITLCSYSIVKDARRRRLLLDECNLRLLKLIRGRMRNDWRVKCLWWSL